MIHVVRLAPAFSCYIQKVDESYCLLQPLRRQMSFRCHPMQQQSVRTSQRVSRFLASWGVDRPFANLAETAQLAQHIGESVRRFHALLLFYGLFV